MNLYEARLQSRQHPNETRSGSSCKSAISCSPRRYKWPIECKSVLRYIVLTWKNRRAHKTTQCKNLALLLNTLLSYWITAYEIAVLSKSFSDKFVETEYNRKQNTCNQKIFSNPFLKTLLRYLKDFEKNLKFNVASMCNEWKC